MSLHTSLSPSVLCSFARLLFSINSIIYRATISTFSFGPVFLFPLPSTKISFHQISILSSLSNAESETPPSVTQPPSH